MSRGASVVRNTTLILIALSLSLAGCQAPKPANGGAQVALIRAAMIEAGRSKSAGVGDASRAIAAVEAYRGGSADDGGSAGAVTMGGGG